MNYKKQVIKKVYVGIFWGFILSLIGLIILGFTTDWSPLILIFFSVFIIISIYSLLVLWEYVKMDKEKYFDVDIQQGLISYSDKQNEKIIFSKDEVKIIYEYRHVFEDENYMPYKHLYHYTIITSKGVFRVSSLFNISVLKKIIPKELFVLKKRKYVFQEEPKFRDLQIDQCDNTPC